MNVSLCPLYRLKVLELGAVLQGDGSEFSLTLQTAHSHLLYRRMGTTEDRGRIEILPLHIPHHD